MLGGSVSPRSVTFSYLPQPVLSMNAILQVPSICTHQFSTVMVKRRTLMVTPVNEEVSKVTKAKLQFQRINRVRVVFFCQPYRLADSTRNGLGFTDPSGTIMHFVRFVLVAFDKPNTLR